MTLHIDRAVRMLALVEIGALNDQHRQSVWGMVTPGDTGFTPAHDDEGHIIIDNETLLPIGVGSCSTAFCAAGWALHDAKVPLAWVGERTLVANETADGRHISDAACEWLGIDPPSDRMSTDGGIDYEREDLFEDGVSEEFEDFDRWHYPQDMPRLFDQYNSIETLYAEVVKWWPEPTDVDHVRQLVEDEMLRMQSEAVSR